jgi:hypothetical protein
MNLRDKHPAHSLSETRREKKAGPLPPVKFGDEREILDATLPIVEALYCWVYGSSFSFQECEKRSLRMFWLRISAIDPWDGQAPRAHWC